MTARRSRRMSSVVRTTLVIAALLKRRVVFFTVHVQCERQSSVRKDVPKYESVYQGKATAIQTKT